MLNHVPSTTQCHPFRTFQQGLFPQHLLHQKTKLRSGKNPSCSHHPQAQALIDSEGQNTRAKSYAETYTQPLQTQHEIHIPTVHTRTFPHVAITREALLEQQHTDMSEQHVHNSDPTSPFPVQYSMFNSNWFTRAPHRGRPSFSVIAVGLPGMIQQHRSMIHHQHVLFFQRASTSAFDHLRTCTHRRERTHTRHIRQLQTTIDVFAALFGVTPLAVCRKRRHALFLGYGNPSTSARTILPCSVPHCNAGTP